MRFTNAIGLLASISISGCATPPDQVTASYVSPSTYSSYNCRQIISERNTVVQKVNELNGAQLKKANNDQAAMAVGLVLFWPALFFLGNKNDLAPQLAQMKGTYDALTAAGVSRKCFPPPATAPTKPQAS